MRGLHAGFSIITLGLLLAACASTVYAATYWRESIRPSYRHETFRFHGVHDAIRVQAQNSPYALDEAELSSKLTEIISASSRLYGLKVEALPPSSSSQSGLDARLIFRFDPDETRLAGASCSDASTYKTAAQSGAKQKLVLTIVYCKRDEEMSSIWASFPASDQTDSPEFAQMIRLGLQQILPPKNPVERGNCRFLKRSNC